MTTDIVGEASKERLIAAFIDNVIGFALMMMVAILFPEGFPILKFIFYILIYFAYFIVFEALWSRTLGKYFQGLIVRKLDGSRSDWKTAMVRGILRLIEVNPILFGALPAGLVIISSDRKQRIGDILAGTLVVSDKTKWHIDNPPSMPAPGEIMILSRLLEKLGNFDDSSIIYADRNPEWIANSRAGIYLPSDDQEGIEVPEGLSYLMEVYVAKEVIEVWEEKRGRNSSIDDKCQAVIYFAENENYIECP